MGLQLHTAKSDALNVRFELTLEDIQGLRWLHIALLLIAVPAFLISLCIGKIDQQLALGVSDAIVFFSLVVGYPSRKTRLVA